MHIESNAWVSRDRLGGLLATGERGHQGTLTLKRGFIMFSSICNCVSSFGSTLYVNFTGNVKELCQRKYPIALTVATLALVILSQAHSGEGSDLEERLIAQLKYQECLRTCQFWWSGSGDCYIICHLRHN